MKPRIFLDIDGVVCDFIRPAFAFHGCGEHFVYPDVGWDCVKACNILRARRRMPELSGNEFWNAFDYDFWANLPLFPRACEFVKFLGAHSDLYFATSVTLNPMYTAGRVAWIQKHFPTMNRRFFIGAKKALFAQPGSILIDDCDANCEAFEAHGGKAILMPRPWNKGRRNKYDLDITSLYDHVIKELSKCV